MRQITHFIFILAMVIAIPVAYAQQDHHGTLNERGGKVMGVSQEKTTHHFELNQDGGLIEARADDVKDIEVRDQIRTHFQHIARMFAAGNFNAPMLVHAQNVPRTAVMTQQKDNLHWDYEELPRGARLRVVADNKTALDAVHEFLRFQIEDHHTGDCKMVR